MTMNKSSWVVFGIGAILGVFGILADCQSCKGGKVTTPTTAQLEKDSAAFCKARADYKLVAAAALGALDPKPGSPRAILEAEEDVFCLAHTNPPDAGK